MVEFDAYNNFVYTYESNMQIFRHTSVSLVTKFDPFNIFLFTGIKQRQDPMLAVMI